MSKINTTQSASGVPFEATGSLISDNIQDVVVELSVKTDDIETALDLKYNASNPAGYQTAAQVTSTVSAASTTDRDRTNHTGTQLSSTVSDFAVTVRSTVLTGLSLATNVVISATDTVLSALGKLQAQLTQAISDVNATFLTKADKLLTGIVFTDTSNVLATDEVTPAIGKLQAQINVWNEFVVTTALTNNSNTTLTNITALAFPVTSGKSYRIECMLRYRSTATTTGLVLTTGLTAAVGTLALVGSIPSGVDGLNHVHQGSITASGDLVIAPSTPTANLDFCASIEGIFVCTTSGTITPQFRSEVNGQTVTIQIGSNLIVREF